MLKTRVMPILLYKDLGLVKGVGFDSWRPIGSLMQAVKVYNMREVDELVFLDITATRQGRSPNFALVDDFADECFMPLTVGGGVRSLGDVRSLLEAGADKVAVNTAAVESPELIGQVAKRFGSQCVVVSIDARRSQGKDYEVFTHAGTKATGLDPRAHAKRMQELGAGEILITSIDRDGTLKGYDIELIRGVSEAVSLPVIACGGAGSYAHMVEALASGKATAVAASSMFHFTQQTPLEAKRFLSRENINVRI